MECWSTGVLEYWNKIWSIGVVEYWNIDTIAAVKLRLNHDTKLSKLRLIFYSFANDSLVL